MIRLLFYQYKPILNVHHIYTSMYVGQEDELPDSLGTYCVLPTRKASLYSFIWHYARLVTF